MPRRTAKCCSRCRLPDCADMFSEEAVLLGGIDADTATGRCAVGTLVGGTYSLRLRLRECFRATSPVVLLASEVSCSDMLTPSHSLDPDLDEEGLRMCEESPDRTLTTEPFFDVVDEVRERECDSRRTVFHGELFKEEIGDGKGVMSPMAANWGDDRTEAGDRDPALEAAPARTVRRLGVLRGRLVEERLVWRGISASLTGVTGRMLGKSVRIWRTGSPCCPAGRCGTMGGWAAMFLEVNAASGAGGCCSVPGAAEEVLGGLAESSSLHTVESAPPT